MLNSDRDGTRRLEGDREEQRRYLHGIRRDWVVPAVDDRGGLLDSDIEMGPGKLRETERSSEDICAECVATGVGSWLDYPQSRRLRAIQIRV